MLLPFMCCDDIPKVSSRVCVMIDCVCVCVCVCAYAGADRKALLLLRITTCDWCRRRRQARQGGRSGVQRCGDY